MLENIRRKVLESGVDRSAGRPTHTVIHNDGRTIQMQLWQVERQRNRCLHLGCWTFARAARPRCACLCGGDSACLRLRQQRWRRCGHFGSGGGVRRKRAFRNGADGGDAPQARAYQQRADTMARSHVGLETELRVEHRNTRAAFLCSFVRVGREMMVTEALPIELWCLPAGTHA